MRAASRDVVGLVLGHGFAVQVTLSACSKIRPLMLHFAVALNLTNRGKSERAIIEDLTKKLLYFSLQSQ